MAKLRYLIAYWDGVFYDPWYGVFNSRDELLNYWNARIRSGGKWRIDWYMEISEQNDEMASGD